MVTVRINKVEYYGESETEYRDFEVLDREEVETIIRNLNTSEVIHEVYNEARSHTFGGTIRAYIDIEDGELNYSYTMHNNSSIGYFTNVYLYEVSYYDGDDLNYPDSDEYLLTEQEHLDYFNKLKEVKEENDEHYYVSELVEEVIEHFGLDKDELLEEYYKEADGYLEDFRDDIDEQLDKLYANIVEDDEE